MQGEQSSDKQWPRKLSDSVWEFCAPDDPTVEIIFFHGIQLCNKVVPEPCLNTWKTKGRSSSTEYWPQTFFAKDELLTGKGIKVRALTAAYDPSKVKTDSSGRVDVFLIAEKFIQAIVKSHRVNVGQKKDVPVILVAHSFGGLLVKDFLMKAQKEAARKNGAIQVKSFLENLAGVVFYSTPNLGLKDEVFQYLFPKKDHNGYDVEYSDLVPVLVELNSHVARLQKDLEGIIKSRGIQVSEFFEEAKTDVGGGKFMMLLEEGSGRSPSAEATCINEDHFDVCKPEDLTSESYSFLADVILKITGEKADSKAQPEAMDADLPSVPRTSLTK